MQETIKKIEKPLYLQVADDIRNRIQNGEFKAKEKLDTEFELEKQYSVSRITIRKALELLVDEGILMRKRRVGTYVMEKKIARNLNWSGSFSKSCKMEGNQVRTKLLSAELIPARPNDIERLQIPKDDYKKVKNVDLQLFYTFKDEKDNTIYYIGSETSMNVEKNR